MNTIYEDSFIIFIFLSHFEAIILATMGGKCVTVRAGRSFHYRNAKRFGPFLRDVAKNTRPYRAYRLRSAPTNQMPFL